MDKKICKEKLTELASDLAEALIDEGMRLYSSGGIDTEQYTNNEYILPKILITAAIYSKKDGYTPLRPEHKKNMENLRHF